MAAVDNGVPLPSALDGSSRQVLGGVIPVIAAMLVLVCLLVGWAVFLRKPQGRRKRGRLIESKHKPPVAEDSGSKSGRRRRRREKKRPRNPTLAETGGLPPLGAGDSVSPPL